MKNKLVSFFLRHPSYFIKTIETKYPLSSNQLKKYSGVLNWQRVSYNEQINWNSELINEFKDQIDWGNITTNPSVFKDSKLISEFEDFIEWNCRDGVGGVTLASNTGIPWSIELIEKYKHKLDFEYLSENESLPWSEELLVKYYNRWHFPNLTQNNALPWTLQFFENYFVNEKLHDCYFTLNNTIHSVFEIVDKWNRLLDWHNILSNPKLPWLEKDLMNRWAIRIQWHSIACNEFLLSLENFFEDHLKYFRNSAQSLYNLSYNEGIRWTPEFIAKHKDYWYWENISQNRGIPWSIELIEKYSNRLVWGCYEEHRKVENLNEEEKKNGVTLGTFHPGLAVNPSLPWSIDFLLYYENYLDEEMLFYNSGVWEKAFKPYIDDKMIDTILKII